MQAWPGASRRWMQAWPGEPFGVFCPFGGIAVTDCIGGDGEGNCASR